MFLQVASVFLLATSAVASPIIVARSPVSIPIARRLNLTGAAKVVELDQARARTLRTGSFAVGADNTPATNAVVSYVATVGIGAHATPFDLIVDTGSANTWVNARPLTNPYEPSSTSKLLALSNPLYTVMSVTYGSGSFTGTMWSDQVAIGDVTIPNQTIGVATLSNGFTNVDGILGIGPTDLTKGTITLAGNDEIPTVTDNLFKEGTLTTDEVGISFIPATESESGEITFGGTDPSRFTGSINYVPLTSTAPSSSYVGINQTITYGSNVMLSNSAGIVDTGTTLLLLASDIFAAYTSATGAVMDSTTGLLMLTSAACSNLQSLVFTIGGVDYELTPDAQIWPRALNTAIGGTASGIYLVVGSTGTASGSGMDFINGMSFLERFYTVYDSGTPRFGIAKTAFTDSLDN